MRHLRTFVLVLLLALAAATAAQATGPIYSPNGVAAR
jgi:hypothetical protein